MYWNKYRSEGRMTLEDEWKELRAIADKELKDRKDKENELVKCGHTSHICAYPFIS